MEAKQGVSAFIQKQFAVKDTKELYNAQYFPILSILESIERN